MGDYNRRELSYEKRLEIAFFQSNGKRYGEVAKIIGCSKNRAFAVCKKIYELRTFKNLPRAGRPKKFRTPRQEKSLLSCNAIDLSLYRT